MFLKSSGSARLTTVNQWILRRALSHNTILNCYLAVFSCWNLTRIYLNNREMCFGSLKPVTVDSIKSVSLCCKIQSSCSVSSDCKVWDKTVAIDPEESLLWCFIDKVCILLSKLERSLVGRSLLLLAVFLLVVSDVPLTIYICSSSKPATLTYWASCFFFESLPVVTSFEVWPKVISLFNFPVDSSLIKTRFFWSANKVP